MAGDDTRGDDSCGDASKEDLGEALGETGMARLVNIVRT
jgi:hypothetical protein